MIEDKTEAKIANKLIKAALAKGWLISVHEGGDWAIKKSSSFEAVKKELASTDSDVLHFQDAAGQKIGVVWLIYGNGEDLISDHSDNAAINALMKEIGQ